MATPWIEDARKFEVTKDLVQSGILLTDEIRDFLSPENTFRTIVMAPKGCGKTLLIKYKRKALEKSGYKLLPENKLVDIGPDHAPPFNELQIKHIVQNPPFWSTLWQISIAIATIKSHVGPPANTFEAPIRNVFENDYLNEPFHIFAQLLNSTPQLHYAAQKDYKTYLLPMFSKIHSPTAIFVDNVDEFFAQHLVKQARHLYFGQLEQEIWHNAQVGLLMAVRQLSAHNPHIKVFGTIRTEAYNAKKDDLLDLANLRQNYLRVRFTKDDLRKIFEQNIRIEKKNRLAAPNAESELERFFGAQNLFIRHHYTGRREFIFDYILRHTLGRPRDLMTIGSALSAVRPEHRSSEAIREAVNDASADVGFYFVTDAAPHHVWFDEASLFELFDRNVLEPAQLRTCAAEYDSTCERGEGDGRLATSGMAAFGDLYRCGLLGAVVSKPIGRGAVQKFESTFDVTSNIRRMVQEVPSGRHFLVHPVLGSYLMRRWVGFSKHVDSINIISPNADWIEDDGMRFVLQADVCGYTEIMKDPAIGDAFPRVFENIKQDARDGIEYYETIAGDAFALSDRSGYLLVRAAQRIAAELQQSIFHAEIRFGLDYGHVHYERDDANNPIRFGADICVQRSARLQNGSAPGHILMFPQVRDALSRYDVDWPFFKLTTKHNLFRVRRAARMWQLGKGNEELPANELVALNLFETVVE